MSKYPITLRDYFRFRVIGNRFASRRAAFEAMRDTFRTLLVIASILLAYGIAGRLDYEEELRQEAEAQQARAERMTAAVGECMEGRGIWISDDRKTAVKCRQAEEVPL